MDFIRRAVISLTNRRKSSIIIFLLFFVIFSFIFSGFAIQDATEKSSIEVRKKLGAKVNLIVDDEKIGNLRSEELSIPYDMVENISKLPEVKNFQVNVNGSALKGDLKNIEANRPEDMQSASIQGNGVNTNIPVFMINGLLDSEGFDAFKQGENKLLEGEHIKKDDTGNLTLIEESLSKKNNLKVGDTFNLQVSKDKKVTFTVKGIYKSNKKVDERMAFFEILQPGNAIYTNYTAAFPFSGGLGISQASFQLNDPAEIDEFSKKASDVISSTKKDVPYVLDSQNEAYEQMVGPIEQVASFSKIIVQISLLAGSLILLMLIALSIKERKNEIGILMSLGESKLKIVGQLIIEIFLVAILSFVLSASIANNVGQSLSDNLISQQIKKEKDLEKESKKSQNQSNTNMISKDIPKKSEPVEKINVQITSKIFAFVGASGVLIIIIATSLSSIMILRLKPKDVFSKKE